MVAESTYNILSDVCGWIYFVAWSISFYPQIILNYRRKSVTGFSFDFLLLNITGFFSYMVFNSVIYFDKGVQREYIEKEGSLSVQVNDVVFAIHAFVMCIITGYQVLIYDRGNQKNSPIVLGIAALAWITILVSFLVVKVGHEKDLVWFLFMLGYVKVAVSFIKYIPQAIMNYRRKSTIGWSIINIQLDFTGGAFSFLQMLILSLRDGNNDQFSNVPKLGLSVLSVVFDILFIFQHYVLYKHSNDWKQEITADLQPTEKTGLLDIPEQIKG